MQAIGKALGAARQWAEGGANGRAALAALLRDGFDWAYGKAVDGMPGLDGAQELAARHAARHQSRDAAVKALIARQAGIAGAAGFVTGCGGFVALPAALPANLASALYIQARLVAAIAHLRGHDVRSDEVRALALACLTGSRAADTLKDAGVRLGTRLTRDAIAWVSPALFNPPLFNEIRHASHVPLACGAGAARLGRFVPLAGGLVAGSFDAALTRLIGHTADRVFSRPAARAATPDEA
jgi:EcsC protein family